MNDERTPLLYGVENEYNALRSANHNQQPPSAQTQHRQFCHLVGLIPSDVLGKQRDQFPKAGPNTLYERARHKRRSTQLVHAFTTSLSNTLLLSQVVLGASLTALGAANANGTIIAIFGALNTVIAGLIAYLKSRGQPMRSRMFKDDLERVVDEIENSEIMWYGISNKMHGYDDIDIEDEVSVRSEVARLTRLYDRAIRNNTMNNPDAYFSGHGNNDAFANFRAHAGQAALPAISAAAIPQDAPAPAPAAPPQEPPPAPPAADRAPATDATSAAKPDKDASKAPASDDKSKGASNGDASKATPVSKVADPQASGGATQSTPDAAKKDSPAAAAPPAPSPKPLPPPAQPVEPPAGVPLGADVDEGPVTAPTKKKDKSDGDKK